LKALVLYHGMASSMPQANVPVLYQGMASAMPQMQQHELIQNHILSMNFYASRYLRKACQQAAARMWPVLEKWPTRTGFL
jgi:hypothetical protein